MSGSLVVGAVVVPSCPVPIPEPVARSLDQRKMQAQQGSLLTAGRVDDADDNKNVIRWHFPIRPLAASDVGVGVDAHSAYP